jgi:type II secretory pathway predicted ATPase ExeA
MPGNGHVRCGGRARETGRAESRHRALVRSHVRVIHGHARGMPRAINRLAVTALLAACTQNKTIADEQSARTAIAEETANATD